MENRTRNQHPDACPLGRSDCPIQAEMKDLRARIEQLESQVNTDPLTQLFNVRHLRFSLEQEMERTVRSQQSTSFILLDVDYFKNFNDRYGHVTGDKVLIHLACLLRNTVRRIDIPCRYGGEEFAIVLPSTPLLVGIQVAERIRQTVENTPLMDLNEKLSITISAGVASFVYGDSMDGEDLIKRADAKLYQAKERGRNCVQYEERKREEKSAVTAEEKDALFAQLHGSIDSERNI